MTPFYLLLCFIITSVYGRVAVTDVLLEADLNKIHDESKIDPIRIEDQDDVTNDDGLSVIPVVKKLCHVDEDNNIVSDIEPCDDTIKIDNGTALILTPLIEQGRVEEARNACRVDRSLFLGIDSYSGFLTVNSTYKSHLFFWYFPSFAKPINETPWIIWLQGGPGASSLTGLFDEIGPFSANDEKLKFNPHTWLMNHSLVFIDNPVGTGYSFTEHEDGYAQDMATYGKHLHIALRQLIQIFPELRVAPLYVAGESYAGKYVPALGMEIHKHNEAPGTDINFKGLIIGNGYMEPDMIKQLVRSFYNFGMLEQEQVDIVQPYVDVFRADIAANRSVEAKEKWGKLVGLVLSMSNQRQAYNFLSDELQVGKFVPFLLKPEIKRALHVGDIKFSFINTTVNSRLAPDFLSSSKPLFEELLNTYRVLVYCGHLDQMLPCVMTSERLRLWKWSESKEFIESWRLPFYLGTNLAGYHKTGGNLTWAVVRGAGHMVPLDQPASSQFLISKWTHRLPLTKMSPLTFMSHPLFLRKEIQKLVADANNQTSNCSSVATNQTSNCSSVATNQTSNCSSVATNQTMNCSSDAMNQTSEQSIVVKTNLTISENSTIVKTNKISDNSTIFKTHETSANSITDINNESSENNLINTTNQNNDAGDQSLVVYM